MSRALPGEDNPGFFQGIKEWFSPPPPPPAPGMYQWLSDSIETANYTDRKKGQELLTMAIEIAKKESPDEMHNMLSMRSYISSLLLIHPFLDQGMKRQIYDFDLAQAIAIEPGESPVRRVLEPSRTVSAYGVCLLEPGKARIAVALDEAPDGSSDLLGFLIAAATHGPPRLKPDERRLQR